MMMLMSIKEFHHEEWVKEEQLKESMIPEMLPYKIVMDGHNNEFESESAREWCKQHIGKEWILKENTQGVWSDWICVWDAEMHGIRTWHFKNEKDAVLFALRWV
jgi:hypothetical protein